MKITYDNKFTLSFFLWLDNLILSKGEGFVNINNQELITSNDPRIGSQYRIYSSPQTQWVTDSSVSNVNIPNSVEVNGGSLSRSDGIIFDFINGRVLSPNALQNPEVSFAKKSFNLYIANQYEANLLLEKQFNGENVFFPKSGSRVNQYIAPCILISAGNTENTGFALGGTRKTDFTIEIMAISDTREFLESLGSVLRDSSETTFPMVAFEDAPFDRFGDLKNGEYSYADLKNKYKNFGSQIFVDKVFIDYIKGVNSNDSRFFTLYSRFSIYDIRNV